MSTTAGELRPAAVSSGRTPFVVIACGCAIALLSFGPRASVGFFIKPMGQEFAWSLPGSATSSASRSRCRTCCGVWWLSIRFGVLSALINLPIVEKPVSRNVAQPA